MTFRVGTYGIDPELFVVRGNSHKATSLHLVDELVDWEGVRDHLSNPITASCQPDGFALEFTNDPTTCRDYLVPSLAAKFKSLYNGDFGTEGLKLSAKAAMELNKESLRGTLPMGVKEYGCVPDRNAYTFEEQTPEWPEYQDDWRYLGGHVHFSLPGFPEARFGLRGESANHSTWFYDDETANLIGSGLAILWDATVALPMVAMLGHTNDYGEARRRTYYGRAGSHRVKGYGVEYRVLSGMILQSPFMFTWVLGALRKTVRNAHSLLASGIPQQPEYVDRFVDAIGEFIERNECDVIRKAIDEHDVSAARAILKDNGELMQQLYQPRFYKLLVAADDKGVPLDMNFARAWALERNIRNHEYPGIETLMLYEGREIGERPDPVALRLRVRFPQLALSNTRSVPAWTRRS